MAGYRDDAERTRRRRCAAATTTRATSRARDDDGYITYVGRTDDVFKASDYRISPFELESVLIEHEAVAEAAVVPSPDPLRLAVPEGLRRARRRATSRRARPRSRSCATRASTSRRTSASAGSSSPSCPRRSRARSAGSSCATRESERHAGAAARRADGSSGRTTSPSSSAERRHQPTKRLGSRPALSYAPRRRLAMPSTRREARD